MLYATNTGTAPVALIVVVAASTSANTLLFQFPIHFAIPAVAILSICSASVPREVRHAVAVVLALE